MNKLLVQAPEFEFTEQTISTEHYVISLEMRGRDDKLAEAFYWASRRNLSDEVLRVIDQHEGVLFATCPEQSQKAVLEMVQVSSVLLAVGLPAIKVECSGVAWSAAQWLDSHAAVRGIADLGRLWVCWPIGADDGVYSCGMHNFGLPDAFIHGDPAEPITNIQLDMLLHYQLSSGGAMKGYGTTSLPVELPQGPEQAPAMDTYQSVLTYYKGYSSKRLHYNPYGLISLGRGEYINSIIGTDERFQKLIDNLLHPDVRTRTGAIEYLPKVQSPTAELLKAVGIAIQDPVEALQFAVITGIKDWAVEDLLLLQPAFEETLRHGTMITGFAIGEILRRIGPAGIKCATQAFDPSTSPTNPLAMYGIEALLSA